MRHLIDIQELSTTEIEELLRVAEDIIANPSKYAEACHRTLPCDTDFRKDFLRYGRTVQE